MTRMAFTLIETTLALSITAMIIGSATLLHAYVLRQLGTVSATYSNYRQAQDLLDTIDQVASQAQSYSIPSSGSITLLKLVMPATCTDTNNDGLYDLCTPSRVSKRGIEEWGQGKRIWFYPGDITGALFSNGKPCAAIVTGDGNPSAGTTIIGFLKYSNGKLKHGNIDSMSFSAINSDSFSVTVTASSNTSELAERKPDAAQDAGLKDSYSITRTIFLARWRK